MVVHAPDTGARCGCSACPQDCRPADPGRAATGFCPVRVSRLAGTAIRANCTTCSRAASVRAVSSGVMVSASSQQRRDHQRKANKRGKPRRRTDQRHDQSCICRAYKPPAPRTTQIAPRGQMWRCRKVRDLEHKRQCDEGRQRFQIVAQGPLDARSNRGLVAVFVLRAKRPKPIPFDRSENVACRSEWAISRMTA